MLNYLIVPLCLSFNPIYNNACSQALNAATIQYHIKSTLDDLQHNIEKDVETEVLKRSRREFWVVLLGSYQIYSQQSFVFNAPAKPFADSISGNISNNSSGITFSWSF